MKKMALIAAFLVIGLPGMANAQDQWVELLRQDINTQKTLILTEAMQLDSEQAEKFWPVVREYDLKRAEIVDKRLALIRQYAEGYTTMTPDMAEDIMKESMKIDSDMAKLKKDYFGKVSKELTAVEGARWLQVENFIDNLLRLQVQAELPLVQHGVDAAVN